jgi:hypothetical protein
MDCVGLRCNRLDCVASDRRLGVAVDGLGVGAGVEDAGDGRSVGRHVAPRIEGTAVVGLGVGREDGGSVRTEGTAVDGTFVGARVGPDEGGAVGDPVGMFVGRVGVGMYVGAPVEGRDVELRGGAEGGDRVVGCLVGARVVWAVATGNVAITCSK